MAGSGGTNAVALVWDEPNAGGPDGNGNFFCLGTGGVEVRYDACDYYRLQYESGLVWKISSCSLFAPATGASVIIFYSDGRQHPYSNGTFFDGYFLLLDNRSGGQWDVNLADHSLLDGDYPVAKTWNNAASAVMLVHTAQGPEVRLRASTTLTPTWNTFIDSQLAASSGGNATVSRKGNPKWHWVAFPRETEHLNPQRNYLRVEQRLNVTLNDPMADYEARISYYLRLVASNGMVTGWVQRWEYWVENGLFSEFVGSVLRPYTILGAENLNDLLAAGGLPLPPGISVTGVYYLPSIQTDATAPGEVQIFKGHTSDDVTIVLQT